MPEYVQNITGGNERCQWAGGSGSMCDKDSGGAEKQQDVSSVSR